MIADEGGRGSEKFQQSVFMGTTMWIERTIGLDLTIHVINKKNRHGLFCIIKWGIFIY